MNAKKRALGKGLGALLDDSGAEAQPTYNVEKDLLPIGTIGKVPIDIIEVNPHQPRSDFDEAALQDLSASIKEQGVIQPITLRKLEENKLQLISGERRLKAAKMAGLAEIPAYIVAADDHALLEMAIVENIQRENLNPIEIAMGYKQLIENYDLTQETLSERLGKSRSSIANLLRLLHLPGEIQIGLREEKIFTGHAKALLAIEDVNTQLDVYHDIVSENLSVREVEDIIKNLSENQEEKETARKKKSTKQQLSQEKEALQQALAEMFEAQVKLKTKADGKGSIVINYRSEQELQRITEILKKNKGKT
ncbi:MAG: ParB/RepB/Spo0J family partition protein [Bacteroidales bacterium]